METNSTGRKENPRMIKITLVNRDNINSRDLTRACKMASKTTFLAPEEVEPYMNAIYNAIQWGKNVR